MTYNDQILIEEYTQARGIYGGVDQGSWATYRTVWAEIDDVSGTDNDASEMRVYQDAKTFKIHLQDAPAVTTKMRINYDSRFFEITRLTKQSRLRWLLMGVAYDDNAGS